MTQTPEQPLAPAPARPYGTDTARVIDHYPDFAIFNSPYGHPGARAKAEDGHLTGDLITALTLDELSGKLDACRRLAGA